MAFRVTASGTSDIPGDVRRAMRDEIYRIGLIKRIVKDIKLLLATEEDIGLDGDVVLLWDEKNESVPSGVQYEDPCERSPSPADAEE